MVIQNYDSTLNLVKERLEQIDKIKDKFSGFPEVQEKLQRARDALVESEKELMTFQSITDESLILYNNFLIGEKHAFMGNSSRLGRKQA